MSEFRYGDGMVGKKNISKSGSYGIIRWNSFVQFFNRMKSMTFQRNSPRSKFGYFSSALIIIAIILISVPGCDFRSSTTGSVDQEPSPGVFSLSPDLDNSASSGIVFVPAYSEIFHLDKKRTTELTITLSVHNMDPSGLLTLIFIDYYTESGKLIRNYLKESLVLSPLETYHVVVEQNDVTGGTGAKFLVGWKSDSVINCPLAESVMIRTASSQGISLTSRGVTIQEKKNSSHSCK